MCHPLREKAFLVDGSFFAMDFVGLFQAANPTGTKAVDRLEGMRAV